jgi:hypothetical protein
VALAGCSSSDSGGGTGGTGATGGSAGSGTGGSGGSTGGTGGTAGSGGSTGGTGGTAGSGGSMGGTGGSGGASAAAKAFCADYQTTCTFGSTGHYASMDDCLTKYDSYSAARQSCVETHLGYAKNDQPSAQSVHCTHAAGAAPCN